MGWGALCREDHLGSECGVAAAEVNFIAHTARSRRTDENNILGNESELFK